MRNVERPRKRDTLRDRTDQEMRYFRSTGPEEPEDRRKGAGCPYTSGREIRLRIFKRGHSVKPVNISSRVNKEKRIPNDRTQKITDYRFLYIKFRKHDKTNK